MGLVADYNVEGVIYAIQKFCHPHQFDRPPIEKACKERYIPFFNFEYDGTIPKAEFQNTIEAFVEAIKPVLV